MTHCPLKFCGSCGELIGSCRIIHWWGDSFCWPLLTMIPFQSPRGSAMCYYEDILFKGGRIPFLRGPSRNGWRLSRATKFNDQRYGWEIPRVMFVWENLNKIVSIQVWHTHTHSDVSHRIVALSSNLNADIFCRICLSKLSFSNTLRLPFQYSAVWAFPGCSMLLIFPDQ